MLNVHCEDGRGCAGTGTGPWSEPWLWSEADQWWLLKPTSPGTQPIKRSSGIAGEQLSSPACELLELPFSALQGMLHLSCGCQPHEDFCRVSSVRKAGPCCWHVPILPFKHLAPPKCLDHRRAALLPQRVLGVSVRNHC